MQAQIYVTPPGRMALGAEAASQTFLSYQLRPAGQQQGAGSGKGEKETETSSGSLPQQSSGRFHCMGVTPMVQSVPAGSSLSGRVHCLICVSPAAANASSYSFAFQSTIGVPRSSDQV